MGDQRPGDNLFTSSVLALDTATGLIKGYHQYQPNDSWDWDEVSPPILVDYNHDGRLVHGLIDAGRDGYLWMLERTSDKINFVDGKPFVKQNVFANLDPNTGRPNIDPARQPGTGKIADFCPSPWGGKNWPPVAYSPKTRLLYIPANENLCGTSIGAPITYIPGQRYSGATVSLYIAPGADHIGELQSWNVDTSKKVWSHSFSDSQLWGPVLATGGGVLFMGGTNDRYFRAYDASNGKILWEFRTGSGVIGFRSRSALMASNISPSSRAGEWKLLTCRRVSISCDLGTSQICRRAARSGCLPWTKLYPRLSAATSTAHPEALRTPDSITSTLQRGAALLEDGYGRCP